MILLVYKLVIKHSDKASPWVLNGQNCRSMIKVFNLTEPSLYFRYVQFTLMKGHMLSHFTEFKAKFCLIELLDHCKGSKFNIHIWAWFSYLIGSRGEFRFYLFGKELISCFESRKLA